MRRFVITLALALGLFSLPPQSAEAAGAHGVVVPDGSKSIGKARFRSAKDWDRTLRFFRSVFRRDKFVVFQTLSSPPGVKAVYIENTKPKRSWDGVNVYQSKNKVFIYILENRDGKKSRKKSSK